MPFLEFLHESPRSKIPSLDKWDKSDRLVYGQPTYYFLLNGIDFDKYYELMPIPDYDRGRVEGWRATLWTDRKAFNLNDNVLFSSKAEAFKAIKAHFEGREYTMKTPPIEKVGKADNDSDNTYDRASKYFDIGHGDEGDYYVWAFIDGDVEVSPKFGEKKSGTHGTIWGHKITDRTYKGRFDVATGKLSIVKPSHAEHQEIPNALIAKLMKAFRGIKHISEF